MKDISDLPREIQNSYWNHFEFLFKKLKPQNSDELAEMDKLCEFLVRSRHERRQQLPTPRR
jgi:hypothetical protein